MSSKNETQIAMTLRSKARTGIYPDVNEGDNVRLRAVTRPLKDSNNNGQLSYIRFRKTIIMEHTR